jgi:hypothetical protein
MDERSQAVRQVLSELCADMSCGDAGIERVARDAHRALLEWERRKEVQRELREALTGQERRL